ncbi:hypothetical protein BDM02DRAFT_1383631 [Thelephora ganbajun]|uniref:Uncharacterized protein n=1 Tax=Thelephora ganbajun TaxID=370292 RepID=A0ACB6ZMG2_THEGA|nr:hypothetical protein BDM02DRAFT_1383631 [Thelephora ganbajun]
MVKDCCFFFSFEAHTHASLFKIPKTVFDSRFPSGNKRYCFASSAHANNLIGVPRARRSHAPRLINPNFSYHSLLQNTISWPSPNSAALPENTIQPDSHELTTFPVIRHFGVPWLSTLQVLMTTRYCSHSNTLGDCNDPQFCRDVLLFSLLALRFYTFIYHLHLRIHHVQLRVYTFVGREQDKRTWKHSSEGSPLVHCDFSVA